MTTKKVASLIKKALPGATIVRGPRTDGTRAARSDAATPTAAALLAKYGGAPALRRSRASGDAAASCIEADLEEAVVQLKASANVPARLNRRTIVINKKTGKIESTSG